MAGAAGRHTSPLMSCSGPSKEIVPEKQGASELPAGVTSYETLSGMDGSKKGGHLTSSESSSHTPLSLMLDTTQPAGGPSEIRPGSGHLVDRSGQRA